VDALKLVLEGQSGLTEREFKGCNETLNAIKDAESSQDIQWAIDQTEKFCQDRAIYNAIMDSISILDGKGQGAKGAIPELLSNALSVSFDPNIGHDYIDDYSSRYDFYHRVESRIPFDLDFFNKITRGGLPRKSLNIASAGVGVGKSLFMCHYAASALMNNNNVLYITLELAEEKVAERIDANLLNVTIDDLMKMPRDTFEKRITRLRERVKGKLIIKEYPTASANSSHFRALLQELSIKKNFKPDVIIIDYLNICSSARVKHGANVNTYLYVKAIAEELRGLAVEFDVPILSATQVTRSGFTSSDPGLEDTAESFGLPATADMMFALVTTEELENLGQIMVKQLKNRYNDPSINKRFTIGIDRSRMKLFDLEQSAQQNISDSGQAQIHQLNPSKSKFGALKV
jgi:archaellum biogenesis ATPase FlaH